MTKRPTYTTAEIITVLKKVHGLVFMAAKRLGCTEETIRVRAHKEKAIRDVIRHERRIVVDEAEEKLRMAIKDREPWAIALVLKTLGRNRGYVERSEHRVGGDSKAPPIKIDNQATLESLNLPLDVRKQILDALRKKKVPANGNGKKDSE